MRNNHKMFIYLFIYFDPVRTDKNEKLTSEIAPLPDYSELLRTTSFCQTSVDKSGSGHGEFPSQKLYMFCQGEQPKRCRTCYSDQPTYPS